MDSRKRNGRLIENSQVWKVEELTERRKGRNNEEAAVDFHCFSKIKYAELNLEVVSGTKQGGGGRNLMLSEQSCER
jgi:hypothetical protein